MSIQCYLENKMVGIRINNKRQEDPKKTEPKIISFNLIIDKNSGQY